MQINGNYIEAKGPKGTLSRDIKEPITAKVEEGNVIVGRPDDKNSSKALHGLSRSLIANMVEGVSKGFQKKLLINGVGYRASLKGKNLSMTLGFSHPVEMEPPEGIAFEVSKTQTEVVVTGIDKALVGQVTANIRQWRKTEPYKGKGIRYEGEYVRRKAGKTVSGGK